MPGHSGDDMNLRIACTYAAVVRFVVNQPGVNMWFITCVCERSYFECPRSS